MAATNLACAAEPLRLKIVGSLGGVSQYTRFEEPFWTRRLPELSHGAITATIRPINASGLKDGEVAEMMRLGVVPFATLLLGALAADEPAVNTADLPGLSPDFASLRRTIALTRPHLEATLRGRYGIETLGLYIYPAQVVFCAKPFDGLSDLRNKRVRTSSVGQAEMMTALGAVPVMKPFAEIVPALRDGVVDCAITGTMSGREIGLDKHTTHMHAMAISWGLSVFAAGSSAWAALPAEARTMVQAGVTELEGAIWAAAERDTEEGISCITGGTRCPIPGGGDERPLVLVPATDADRARAHAILVDEVLPRWIDRCGPTCRDAWNSTLGRATGTWTPKP